MGRVAELAVVGVVVVVVTGRGVVLVDVVVMRGILSAVVVGVLVVELLVPLPMVEAM